MAASTYQSIKQAIQDLIAPEIAQLRSGIATFAGEMRGDMGELRGEIGGLKGEIVGLKSEVRRIDDKLTLALDLRERIVAIETKLGM